MSAGPLRPYLVWLLISLNVDSCFPKAPLNTFREWRCIHTFPAKTGLKVFETSCEIMASIIRQVSENQACSTRPFRGRVVLPL